MERSLLLFENSVKSKYSFLTYVDKLERFMKFVGIESYDELSRADNLQIKLEDWIMSLKSQVSPNSIPYYFYGLKS